jgi:hypothetical protein
MTPSDTKAVSVNPAIGGGAIEPPLLPPPQAATDVTQTTKTSRFLIARRNLMANLLEAMDFRRECRAVVQWFIAQEQSG